MFGTTRVVTMEVVRGTYISKIYLKADSNDDYMWHTGERSFGFWFYFSRLNYGDDNN